MHDFNKKNKNKLHELDKTLPVTPQKSPMEDDLA